MEPKTSAPLGWSIVKVVLYLMSALVTVCILFVLYFVFDVERDILAASSDNRPSVDVTGEYHAPKNLFSARLPDGWEVNEDRVETPGASFFSPTGGESIAVYYYKSSNVKADALQTLSTAIMPDMEDPQPDQPIDPQTGEPAGQTARMIAGHKSWETSGDETLLSPELGKTRFHDRVIVMLMNHGYFELEYSCRVPDVCDGKVFDAFITSFRPKSGL
ncbi:MAG: hypothetical protein KGI68_14075 [Alphaproteobacteria bacterium]|nr:hypothetical protein [Alphaproteobacteria bacterium]